MNGKVIKLVALDLDGTLLDSGKQVTARTREVLKECEKRGIQVVPATGRGRNAVAETILTLPGVRYGIFTNGSSVWDLQEDRELFADCIDWKTAQMTVGILRRYPIIYDMYINGGGVCERHFLDTLEDFGLSAYLCQFLRKTRKMVDDIIPYLEETHAPVQKMNLIFRDKETKHITRKALEQLPELLVTSSLPHNLELSAAGVTKGSGLRKLSEYLNVKPNETMACGDGENDLPMLRAAGIGICMENGAPFLKEQADWITLSNDEDGVAAAIERWAL